MYKRKPLELGQALDISFVDFRTGKESLPTEVTVVALTLDTFYVIRENQPNAPILIEVSRDSWKSKKTALGQYVAYESKKEETINGFRQNKHQEKQSEMQIKIQEINKILPQLSRKDLDSTLRYVKNARGL